MNERVKELMLSKGLHKHISEDCQHRMEMLAELIAEECAQICGSQADKKNIRKAFGLKVESNVKYSAPEADNSINSQYNREINLPKGTNNGIAI
jgi:hypothetical protein